MSYEHVSLVCIISMVSAIRLLNVQLKMFKVFPNVKNSKQIFWDFTDIIL